MYLCALKIDKGLWLHSYMLETITKGIIIGLLVSSPMGPINMLTIQRTLNRGWKHGIVTGLGASFSDLIYFVVTLVGLSFISDFFDKYEHIIQTTGSIILILFGFWVYRSNPLRDWSPDKLLRETRYVMDFVSSFLLTLSNVAITVVLIGLFAHFSFNPLADGKSYFAAGFIAFAIAAFAWWFFLTTVVFWFRKHFNRRGLVILNRIVGGILMLLGIIEIVLSICGINL